MAATDVSPFPVKNKAYRAHFLILDADGDPVTGATGLDPEISKDGGAFTNTTNNATVTEVGNGWYYNEITATEMNADTVILVLKTSSSGAKTAHLMIHPVAVDELSAVPSFGAGGSGIEEILAWLVAWTRNKITQTASTTTLFKDDGSTTLASSTITDNGTTLTRGELA